MSGGRAEVEGKAAGARAFLISFSSLGTLTLGVVKKGPGGVHIPPRGGGVTPMHVAQNNCEGEVEVLQITCTMEYNHTQCF